MGEYRIYKVENTVNDFLYVGYTTQSIELRMGNHVSNARSHKPVYSENPFYIAMREIGAENFHISLLEEFEYSSNERRFIYGRERYWMEKLNTVYPFGYNKHAFKLTDADVAIIRFNAYNLTGAQYARLYAIAPSNISVIRHSLYGSRDHVTREYLPANIESYAKHMKHDTFIKELQKGGFNV